MEVSGDLPFADREKAGGRLAARLYGWRRYISIGLALLYFACLLGVTGLLDLLFGLPSVHRYAAFRFPIFLLILGALVVAYIIGVRRFGRRMQIAAAQTRGYDPVNHIRFQVAEDGFHIISAMVHTRIAWAGISEIAPTRTQWLFISSTVGYVVPRRFFPDVAFERTFLRSALGYMSEAARERSKEVKAFAEAG